jgi:hypothetical protein
MKFESYKYVGVCWNTPKALMSSQPVNEFHVVYEQKTSSYFVLLTQNTGFM